MYCKEKRSTNEYMIVVECLGECMSENFPRERDRYDDDDDIAHFDDDL